LAPGLRSAGKRSRCHRRGCCFSWPSSAAPPPPAGRGGNRWPPPLNRGKEPAGASCLSISGGFLFVFSPFLASFGALLAARAQPMPLQGEIPFLLFPLSSSKSSFFFSGGGGGSSGKDVSSSAGGGGRIRRPPPVKRPVFFRSPFRRPFDRRRVAVTR